MGKLLLLRPPQPSSYCLFRHYRLRVMTPTIVSPRHARKSLSEIKRGPFMLSCRRRDDGAIARTPPQTHLMCLFRLLWVTIFGLRGDMMKIGGREWKCFNDLIEAGKMVKCVVVWLRLWKRWLHGLLFFLVCWLTNDSLSLDFYCLFWFEYNIFR